jgi:hypothetical protein
MFNKEIHNHYDRMGDVNVNVTEKRAPTDESVNLLNEMERKAQENFIMKLCDNRPNSLHVEILFFHQYATMNINQKKGIIAFRVTINGKKYERQVPMPGDYFDWAISNRDLTELHQIDSESAIRRYIFFQIMLLVTSAILEDKSSAEYFMEKIQTNGPINLSIDKMQEELQYYLSNDYSEV